MPIIPDFPHILHGGDYNPDQWLKIPGTIDRDFQLMDEAHCNAFSVAIFSWAQLEPAMDQFDFGWLDDIFDRCANSDKKLFLATVSASKPNWLANRFPEILRVQQDGSREPFQTRANCCFSSPVFRERVRIINSKLSERYANHPALGGWHISNEYNGECWCENCRKSFVKWLKHRYKTLENLNQAYWTAFWGHTYSQWEDVEPRNRAIYCARLDWKRFTSDTIIEFMKFEIETIRKYSNKPATSNMMGFSDVLDYWKMGKYCDFIADDCYPQWQSGDVEREMADFAMRHDCHYSMHNKPFLMMESCPAVPNYFSHPKLRRPNEFEREMLLAIGHGADGTMYFQWRKGRGNCEMFHGAVVGHDGTNQTQTFQRVAAYGAKLSVLDGVVDSTRRQDVAVYYDWESEWALKITSLGNYTTKEYFPAVLQYYRALWNQNLDLAVIDGTADISQYKLIVAPMLFMFKPGLMERWKTFVEAGGTLVVSYFSGYINDQHQCFDGGNPGGWFGRSLFGIWNEDLDGLAPGVQQSVTWNGRSYQVSDYAELLHPENDTKVIASYDSQFYAGSPAVTCRQLGKGHIYYIGARLSLDFLNNFLISVARNAGVKPVIDNMPPQIRVSRRIASNGNYYFIYNLEESPVEFTFPKKAIDIWGKPTANGKIFVPASGATVLFEKK